VTDPRWHLAQLNVGRMVARTDAPVVAAFMAALDPINALADASPGFVWRLQTEAGNATDIQEFDDPLLLLNMSVWESIESLRAFTYTTAHTDVLRRRREWFDKLAEAHLVLWWVPAGHNPTTAEATERLEILRRDGPSPRAFTFRVPIGPEAVESGEPLVDAKFRWPELVAVQTAARRRADVQLLLIPSSEAPRKSPNPSFSRRFEHPPLNPAAERTPGRRTAHRLLIERLVEAGRRHGANEVSVTGRRSSRQTAQVWAWAAWRCRGFANSTRAGAESAPRGDSRDAQKI
jgi:hypothetical protein